MDYFSALTAFIQTSESRSFTAAGRKLGLSSSAVGKAVVRLEEDLGVQLFHRSTRAITLTAEGHTFLLRCKHIFAELDEAKREMVLAKQAPQGRLYIGLPQSGTYLLPFLFEFQRTHPLIELEIDFSDRVVNVIEEGFDAVVRIGAVNDSRLKMRSLNGYQHQLFASPDYLARHGTPQKPSDLLHHACLRYRYPTSGKLDAWPLEAHGIPLSLDIPQTAVVNSIEALRDMALSGIGIALLPDFLTQGALKAEMLSPLLCNWVNDCRQVSLLWPSSRHTLPKIRVFVDFLTGQLAKDS